MDFSSALLTVKAGGWACREAWPDEVSIFLVNGSRFTVNREPLLSTIGEGIEVDYHAHIDMRTADGQIVPWSPSQEDLLGDDWRLMGRTIKTPHCRVAFQDDWGADYHSVAEMFEGAALANEVYGVDHLVHTHTSYVVLNEAPGGHDFKEFATLSEAQATLANSEVAG